MSFINKKDEGFRKEAHRNFMDAPSYDIKDPILKLRVSASSCFFGEPMYYHRDSNDKRPLKHSPSWRLSNDEIEHLNKYLHSITPRDWYSYSPKELIESTIDEALNFDIVATLKEAVRLRNEEHIRVTPQVIMVRAANNKRAKHTGLIREYAMQIMKRADEPSTQLAYQLSEFGKPIPNALKRSWKEYLEYLNEYQLAKYRMENRIVKTIDVVRLTHAHSPVIDKLVKDELKITGKTWEAIISGAGSKTENWMKALDVMGHMALLRNLRNLIQNEIPESEFIKKLVDGAKKGQQLPFRYVSAYKAVETIASPNVLDAIEEALELSLDNLPHFSGRVMSLSDNSGSARGTATSSMGTMEISTIGNLSGIITGKISDEGYLGVFGDRLATKPIRKKESIFSMLKDADYKGNGIGQSTENGIWLFWDKAISTKEHWDYVFIYSDMQAGHGGLYGIDEEYRYGSDRQYKSTHGSYSHPINHGYIDVPKLIGTYRAKVNPNVKVFLVQIAGYQDTIIPEFFDKTYILGGWGEGIWKFAKEMDNILPNKLKQ